MPRTLGIAWMTLASGCLVFEDEAPRTDPLAAEVIGTSIIGGFDAQSAKLNGVGSISIMSEPVEGAAPSFETECTGALIGPRTVLTAKHCLWTFAYAADFGSRLVFTAGPDAVSPLAQVAVIDTAGAPGDDGGYTGNGRDVGVMRLEQPLLGVPLVGLASVSDAEVGREFLGIGYGNQGNGSSSATRRLGALALRARAGRTFELLYGSFEAFYKAMTGGAPPAGCPVAEPGLIQPVDSECAYAERMRTMYEETRIEQVEELAVGAGPGDAQPCYGDSGGPLLRANSQGELVAYAVASGGVGSDVVDCDHGAIYASFGAEVMTFLMQALTWRDPCEGLAAAGTCSGEVARRCSTPAEGHRRVVEVDCTLAGLQCIVGVTGATCGEREPTPP